MDRRKHPHPAMLLHVYKAFFACEIMGGELKTSFETSEVDFFERDHLPPISTARVTYQQIDQFFEMAQHLPVSTYFD